MTNRCLCCANILDKHHAGVVDATYLEIIEILFENSEVEAEIGSGICYACEEKLKVAFKFKGLCIYTEDRLHPYVSGSVQNNEKIDLKTVYAKEKQCKEPNDGYVCRLCLELVDECDKHLFLEVLEKENVKDTLEMYLPEVNLDSSEDPIICEPCLQSLINFVDFIASSRLITNTVKVEPARNLQDIYIKLEPLDIVSVQEEKDSGIQEREAITKKFEKNLVSGLYRCLLCSKEYKTIRHMVKHMHQNKSITMHKCLECTFASKNIAYLKKHIKMIHNYSIHSCKECEFKTKYFSNLADHVRIIHSDGADVDHCKMYPFNTVYQGNPSRHMFVLKSEDESKFRSCKICDYRCRYPKEIRDHTNLCHSSNINNLKCELCTYSTKYRGLMDRHIKRHKDISYQCDKCSYKTIAKRALIDHMLVHRSTSEVIMYKCPDCSFQTKYKPNLSRHTKLCHTLNIKNLKCELCTFSTNYRDSIVRHMKGHKDISEVKSYQCAKCSFKTIFKCTLVRHVLVHKSTSEVEMYKCSDCSYQTKYQHCLSRHTKLCHTLNIKNLKCELCPFSTNYRDSIVRHMKGHKDISEVKSYQCAKCSFKTILKRSLVRHVSVHKSTSKVEMYKCPD